MKSNSKLALSVVATALVVGLIAGGVAFVANTGKQQNNGADIATEPNNPSEKTYRINSKADLAINISDANALARKSPYIALAQIDSLDGSDNYGQVAKQYTAPYTYGKMTILKSLKGDLAIGATTTFTRLGGTISAEQYLKGLSEAERTKLQDLANYKQVQYAFEDDINIESGKTYLVYLTEDEVFRDGAYEIVYFQGGLREVQTSTGYSTSSNDHEVKVLNNWTGAWENLSDVVKSDAVAK